MDAANPFGQPPTTPEPIIARVRRGLSDDLRRWNAPADDVDRAAEEAVRSLWDGRVKTFVEVLALRQAREALLGGVVAAAAGAPPAAARPVVSPAADDDSLLLDDRDSLLLSDDGRIA